MANIIDITSRLDLGGYGNIATDYIGSSSYICDMVAEIADIRTSIYHSDILDFIRENPEALEEVVNEGLYDPSTNYNIYNHGQAAEYMVIEQDIYNHMEDILYNMALLAWWQEYGVDIPDDLAEEMEKWANSGPDRVDEIDDIINDYLTSAEED